MAAPSAPRGPEAGSPRRVALALGSGGARGYAHIGAIEVLEERGMEVVAVAGCSMGALVGALHAAGRLDDYVEWVKGLSQLDVIRLLDPSLSAPGAIRASAHPGTAHRRARRRSAPPRSRSCATRHRRSSAASDGRWR